MSHGVYPTPSAHSGLIQRNTSSSSRSLAGCYLSLALNLKHRGNSDCLWEPQHIFSYEFRFCILNDRRVFKPKLLQVPHVNVDYSRRGSRAASQLRAGLMTFAHFFFSSCTDLLVKKKERERNLRWRRSAGSFWFCGRRRWDEHTAGRSRTVTTSCKQMHDDESRWSACGSRLNWFMHVFCTSPPNASARISHSEIITAEVKSSCVSRWFMVCVFHSV